MVKQTYEKPVLRAHGKVEDLTKGGASGPATDAFFPAGTPLTDVTFS